jgi:antitoxin YefM
VLLGAEDYDAMLETLAILSELKLVKEVGQGLKDLESADTFTMEQVRAGMRAAAPKG